MARFFKIEGIEEKISSLAEPVAESMGLELVDVEYTMDRGSRVLRIYIDKPGGVNVDDCGEFSREFSTILDVEDPTPVNYNLEVSSPGLDRPLVKEKDFVRFVGQRARIRTKTPVDGRKNFHATIEGASDGRVTVLDFDGKRFVLDLAQIDKARLEVEL